MFSIEMLPAEYGDCLWIEYGPSPGNLHRILIDTGTPNVLPALENRVAQIKDKDTVFDLFVITHVDDDHLGSAVRFLQQRQELGISFRDIWFNGFVHLQQAETRLRKRPASDLLGASEDDLLGPVQGEQLTETLVKGKLPWNKAFSGNAIMLSVDDGELPRHVVNGMTLTLLSPAPEQLQQLCPIWKKTVIAAGLVPGETGEDEEEAQEKEAGEEEDLLGEEAIDVDELAEKPFKEDHAPANGTSIVLLAEYDNKKVLLGADAFPSRILESVRKLQEDGTAKLALNALKMPHHGSRANINLELLDLLDCENFLFSTNGKKFKHPNAEAVARVLKSRNRRPTALHFNYRSEFNQIWDDGDLMGDHKYQANFGGSRGYRLVL